MAWRFLESASDCFGKSYVYSSANWILPLESARQFTMKVHGKNRGPYLRESHDDTGAELMVHFAYEACVMLYCTAQVVRGTEQATGSACQDCVAPLWAPYRVQANG